MPRELPFAWLAAEVAAWPLVSDAAFARGCVDLDADVADALARDLEPHVRPRAAGLSLHSLGHVQRAVWQAPNGGPTPLHLYVSRLAADHLAWTGDGVHVCWRERSAMGGVRPGHSGIADDAALAAVRWRWLSFALPADLLLSAVAEANGCLDPPAERVRLLDRSTARHLTERETAVTHLHVGSALTFGSVWSGLMRSAALSAFTPRSLEDSGALPFGDAAAFHGRLLQAAVTRVLAASFLWAREVGVAPSGFAEFLGTPPSAAGAARGRRVCSLGSLAARLRSEDAPSPDASSSAAERAWAELYACVAAFTDPSVPAPSMAAVRALYERIVWPHPAPACHVGDIARGDPLACWLAPAPGLASPEMRFAARALRYLAVSGDDAFARAFWQYERVRARTHRHLVEAPGTAGLDWFSRHYRRISPLRAACEGALYDSALRVESQDVWLASLEARTSPGMHWHEVRDEVRKLARAACAYRPPPGTLQRPEVGLVLHFIKLRDGERDGRRVAHADPGDQPAYACRYGAWFARCDAQRAAIDRALLTHPELLVVLRGVDVANVELAVPTWPVLPLLIESRDASRTAATALAQARPDWMVPPLRVTYHAGEDFARLVHGLRLVHEPLEFGAVGHADRIGHAVALGASVERWAAGAAVTMQAREERLDDLLWELERYQRGDIEVVAARAEMVRHEVGEHARAIHGRSVDCGELMLARRMRHQPHVLRALGYPFLAGRFAAGARAGRTPPDAWELLVCHLTDADVYACGSEPVAVPLHESEVAFLRRAQRWLVRQVDRLNVTVEVNPSSNLVIGDLLDFAHHPAFVMNPLPGGAHADGVSVPVSINSDNPLTFATSVGDEFAYLYLALLRGGVASGAALAWLDGARASGWRSRFTVPASADERVLRAVISGDSLRAES